jgi:hypothetical protein
MKKISFTTQHIFYLISNELNYFTNYLNNILNSNENLKIKNFLILFFTVSFFFLLFLVIYGLKIRLFNPIFEDDFHMLSLATSDISTIVNFPRPVGYTLVALTNLFPINFVYPFYFLLILLNISLSIFVIGYFLRINKEYFNIYIVLCSLISCTFYEYFISLKHIRSAGIFSCLFFYLNLILLFQIFKIKNKYTLLPLFVLSGCLFTLSIFSKEDFFLANIFSFLIFIFYAWKKEDKFKFYFLFSILLVVTLFWVYINFLYYENPFLLDGGGNDSNYEKNLSLFSIIFSYGFYLIYFKPSSFYFIYLIFLIIILRKNKNLIKNSIFFYFLIFLIIFPFSLLHKKFITEYIMQWLPVITGLIAFYSIKILSEKNLTKISNLFIACSFIIILVYASTVTKTKVDRLNKQLIKSSNYISGIKKNLGIIKKHNLIKVDLIGEGDVPNPWYRQTGTWFEREFNLSNKWYVFTEKSSKIYAVKNDFHYDEIKHNSKIKILSRSEINNYEGLTLKFDSQGKLIELIE